MQDVLLTPWAVPTKFEVDLILFIYLGIEVKVMSKSVKLPAYNILYVPHSAVFSDLRYFMVC